MSPEDFVSITGQLIGPETNNKVNTFLSQFVSGSLEAKKERKHEKAKGYFMAMRLAYKNDLAPSNDLSSSAAMA